VQPIAEFYRRNRDTMLSALADVLPAISPAIGWNRPAGGFFLSVDLPFEVEARHVSECALAHGVLMMPMAFFALDDSQNRRMRLSFSAVSPGEIRQGIRALGDYIAGRIEHAAPLDVAGYA
jgi:(S)-3,5-dihydroxyphenylglycine transaminase